MLLQRNIDTYVGMYDFAVTGGAVGSYDLQVPIKGPCLLEIMAMTVVSVTGGAGFTISFDAIVWTFGAGPTTVIGGLIAAAGTATYGVLAVPSYGRYWGGALTNAPVYLGSSSVGGYSLSIGMSIGVNALTAGKIKVFARTIGVDAYQ